jgi:poly(3-hydroxybutyrate) depolymerase
MLYQWYELGHASIAPARAMAKAGELALTHPLNPFAHSDAGRQAAAAFELFERTTRAYEKPSFDITRTRVDGETVAVREHVVAERAFCRVIEFQREIDRARAMRDPNILIVAPMSGHHATLVKGAVEALLPTHNVYVTDWQNARDIQLEAGAFGLDDFIDEVSAQIEYFAGDVHVFAVCQPGVAVLAAVALMEMDASASVPKSVMLAGSPIDTRINPTFVNTFAETHSLAWYEQNVITTVPWPYRGHGRAVYPGFLQLSGFMAMNLERHLDAHRDLFGHLIEGNRAAADRHSAFYDHYLAVMDLPAAFYLDTIERVFLGHDLARGAFHYRERRVDLGAIRRCALMTIEGERDDITGVGQCGAAHGLCPHVAASARHRLIVADAGHFGIFSGSRFRAMVAPDITRFVRSNDPAHEETHDFSTYDCDAAEAAARGEGQKIDASSFDATADNDSAPDPTTVYLERAGLGLLGDPRHRARPDDYDIMSQTTKLWRFALDFVVDSLFGFEDIRRRSRTMASTHTSHTLTSSSVNHGEAGTVDADRQRQTRSRQQYVN